MARDGYRGGMPKYDWSPLCIWRSLLIILIPVTAYSIGLVPSVSFFYFTVGYLDLTRPLHIVPVCFIIVAAFFIGLLFETLIPGLFIKFLRLRSEEGEYEVSLKEKAFFKIALLYVLYQPPMKLTAPFRLMVLRRMMYRLAGMRLGKSSVIPGTELIFDPSVTEIGEGTLIGGFARIYGHVLEDRLIIRKVKIGDDCLVGSDAIVLPGAVIENGVKLGIRSLVPKNQVLKERRTYVGIPVREVKKPIESV